jgi:hypothetical protein
LQLSIFDWFKKEVKQVEPVVETPLVTQVEKPKPKKPRKPKEKKVAPTKVEPRVDILKFDFDPANPRLGSIELDWNDEFVELLQKHGYAGLTAEDIVDAWLNDVCKNIAANQYQGANVPPEALAPSNIVSRKPLGGGKTEVS